MRKRSKNIYGFKLIEVIVIVIITSILCTVATGMIFYKHYEYSHGIADSNLKNNDYVGEFLDVYSSIIKEYYQEVDQNELINSAINGMFGYLGDDYSQHLTKSETADLLEKLAGEYQGIGVEIYQDKIIYEVFEDSPAYKAGIRKDDQIIKVAGEDLTGKDNAYVADKIKNSQGKVEIILLRKGEEISVTVEKDKLYIPSVTSKVIEENKQKIGYIQITTFSNTTYKQFKKSLEKLEKDQIASLIVDVRSNSGGYLVSAKDIASLFIEKGKVIYSLEEKGKTTKYKDKTKAKREYKVAVLINEYSASASEILTAALKDSYGATVVGKKSYGKGKVQQTLNLDDGSMAKYTTAKWLTPKGDCIDKVGITPDVDVDLEINGEEIVDTQLNKAVELLK